MMVVLSLAALAACGGEDEGERVPLGEQQPATEQQAAPRLPEEVQVRVDSANTAYAAGEYQVAADVFRAITEEHPDLSVGWFGLYMAETKLGNTEAAAEAMAEVEARSPGLAPLHEAASDSGHMNTMRVHQGMGPAPQDSNHPAPSEGEGEGEG